ncbi:MAG TPA: Gfo/Idh/MocA family oxidoreductase [Chitinophagales bacterium]|nr:Gfo/Idh/MocA family oxidoreductase [Chitinophagales bacterium]HRK28925.1 Gfo/Idh/MocA family oxidoreductase [Chitinophagales bacterium]
MIQFGIIGIGNIGLRHAQHIAQNPDTHLTAVCDMSDANLPQVRSLFPDVAFYTDYRQMLQHSGLNIVNVCTPNYLHASMTTDALKAGLHVVCEKPMALSVWECSQMIETARQTQKQLFVVKQNRYNPPVAVVKNLLSQGILNNIIQINVNCFWNRNADYYRLSGWRGSKIMDGGCLFTQCSHFIDILYYLAGEVQAVSGSIQNATHAGLCEFEDSGVFLLRTRAGALVSFNFSTSAYQKNMEGSITLLCQNGSVKIGGEYLNTIDYQCIDRYTIPNLPVGNTANDYGCYKGSMSNHDKVIQNVVDTLSGRATVATSGNEGRAVVQIIEDMYASVVQ